MRKIKPLAAVLLVLLMLMYVLLVPLTVSAEGREAASPKMPVLVLYDSLAIGSPQEGNIEALQRLFAAYSVAVTVKSFDVYEEGDLKGYGQVVLVRNKAEEIPHLPERLAQDLSVYQGKLLQIGSGLTDRLRQGLHLQEQRLAEDYATIHIGDYHQNRIAVSNIAYVTSYEGKSYGSLTSERLNKELPYGIRKDGLAYIPYFTNGNLTQWAASYVLKDWLGDSSAGQPYVMIGGIFPFSNLTLVNQLADRLYQAGIPFLAGVQPTFSNWDYPAMQRYMETLKHIQARNGSIIVQTPIVDSTSPPASLKLPNEMNSFLDQLGSSGIAPLGIATEMYWSYDKQYTSDALSFFDSAVVLPNKKAWYREQTDTSAFFPKAVYTISEAELAAYGGSKAAVNPLPMSTALVYTWTDDPSQLDKLMDQITSGWTTFSDYKSEVHTVHSRSYQFTSQKGHIFINGTEVHLNDQIQDVDSAHVYVEEGKKSLTTLFSVQNNILIILICLTLVLFGFFLIIGHRLYKRKYEQTWRS